MKTHITLRPALLAAAFLLHASSIILAQGPLTPLGAPGPTMKTLDQVDANITAKGEKRFPISSLPFSIGVSGSYYLTTPLLSLGGNAITINADNVTLDLNGYSLSSTAAPASGTAVLINGARQNIIVRNGQIRGSTTYSGGSFAPQGFLDGVAQSNATSLNIRVSDLNIVGMGRDGISLGLDHSTFVVERCNVGICVGYGIFAAKVRDCAAEITGNHAIYATAVTNCSGEPVNDPFLVLVGVYGTNIVTSSYGKSESGLGVLGGSVSDSHGTSTSRNGIQANIVTNSFGNSTSGTGIITTSATNCYGVSSSGTGLFANNATNCVGSSTSGPFGLNANPGTASFCRGSRSGGTAISAGIAIGCTVGTGTVNSVNKFLGTP